MSTWILPTFPRTHTSIQGNVTYGELRLLLFPLASDVRVALPALHPGFSIPTVPDGGNHTRDFAKSAAMVEAHKQCLIMSIALAGTGLRVLTDDAFFAEVVWHRLTHELLKG